MHDDDYEGHAGHPTVLAGLFRVLHISVAK